MDKINNVCKMADYTIQDLLGDIMNVLKTRSNNNGLSSAVLGDNDIG